MTKPILVVGSINVDLVVSAARNPRAGETLPGSNFSVFTGGKGANQAAAVARLGYSVDMISKLGKDPFAGTLLEDLQRAGVHTQAITAVPGPSGVALIISTQFGESSIIVVPGANSSLSPQDLEQNAALLQNAAVVLTQLETPIETTEALAQFTARHGVPLILDPAPARPLTRDILSNVDWITPNETEAQVLAGQAVRLTTAAELRELAEHFLSLGPRNVLLKLGERGAYLATSGGTRALIPSYSVTAVDTTAAGDAFNGGFAVALARGLSPVEAARFAAAVAAISVTRCGALQSLPTQGEVNSFLAQHPEVQQESLR